MWVVDDELLSEWVMCRQVVTLLDAEVDGSGSVGAIGSEICESLQGLVTCEKDMLLFFGC